MENPIAYLGKEGYVFRDLLLVVGLQMAKIFTSTQDYNMYMHKPLLYLDLLSFLGLFFALNVQISNLPNRDLSKDLKTNQMK